MMRFIMITVFLSLAIFFSYSSYAEYKNYKIVENSDKSIVLIQDLNQVFTMVEQERAQSAIYLGYDGKTDFNILRELRNSSDNVLHTAQEFIKSNPNYITDQEYISKIVESLQYVRSRVDVISDDHNSILFSYYQSDIVVPVLANINKTIKQLSLGFPDMKDTLLHYMNILEYRKSIEDERSFIAFILSNSQSMSKDDLIQWEGILSQNNTFQISDELKSIFNTQELNKLLSEYRSQIAGTATQKQHSVSVQNWFTSIDKKINRVKSVENILFTKFKDAIHNKNLSKKWILLYGIASIIFLLLVLILLFSKKKTRNRQKDDIANFKSIRDDDMVKVDTKPTATTEIKKDDLVKSKVILEDKKESNIQNITANKNETRVFKSPEVRSSLSFGTDKELFNTLESFTNIIEPLKLYAIQKGVNFDYYIDFSIPSFCMGNIEKIQQVLTLLIEHSIEATPKNETINVKIEKNAESKTQSVIEFSVADSSGYISKGLKSKIDNVVHDGSSKNIVLGSTNTDLIFVGKTVLKMGGTNRIKSKSKDGSTFAFTLSLKKA